MIVEAALRSRIDSFIIDGEAVLLGVDGRSDCSGLHSRKHNDEVQFYAFDVLAMESEDLRQLPLHLRKNNLAKATGTPRRWHISVRLQAGRDWTGPLLPCLPDGA